MRLTNPKWQPHWDWRPEWTPDRPGVWWYLTFEGTPEVAEIADRLRPFLVGFPALDVVPPTWLHSTVCEVGYADELTPETIDHVLESARSVVSSVGVTDLWLGPLDAFPGAVVLHAGPQSPLNELRAGLLAQASTYAPGGTRESNLIAPHVTLAYVNRASDASEVMAALPTIPPTRVSAPSVTLAAVSRGDMHYEWTVLGRVPTDDG